MHGTSCAGLTEIRPGVYTLFDLDQVGIGSCSLSDVAATVLCTVIGHNTSQGTAIVDAGGLALSKDVSAGEFMANVGYGLVAPIEGGPPMEGVFVADVHQEHGNRRRRGRRVGHRPLPDRDEIARVAQPCVHDGSSAQLLSGCPSWRS